MFILEQIFVATLRAIILALVARIWPSRQSHSPKGEKEVAQPQSKVKTGNGLSRIGHKPTATALSQPFARDQEARKEDRMRICLPLWFIFYKRHSQNDGCFGLVGLSEGDRNFGKFFENIILRLDSYIILVIPNCIKKLKEGKHEDAYQRLSGVIPGIGTVNCPIPMRQKALPSCLGEISNYTTNPGPGRQMVGEMAGRGHKYSTWARQQSPRPNR
jgi:hypothetical protein